MKIRSKKKILKVASRLQAPDVFNFQTSDFLEALKHTAVSKSCSNLIISYCSELVLEHTLSHFSTLLFHIFIIMLSFT